MTINSAVSEGTRIEMNLCSDQRLLGAVGSAGSFVAERAGLESGAQAAVATAAEEACRAAFPLISRENSMIKVTVQQFSDRIEITLAYTEDREAAKGVQQASSEKIELLYSVDQVQQTNENGISKTTLIKNLP